MLLPVRKGGTVRSEDFPAVRLHPSRSTLRAWNRFCGLRQQRFGPLPGQQDIGRHRRVACPAGIGEPPATLQHFLYREASTGMTWADPVLLPGAFSSKALTAAMIGTTPTVTASTLRTRIRSATLWTYAHSLPPQYGLYSSGRGSVRRHAGSRRPCRSLTCKEGPVTVGKRNRSLLSRN